ncbi:MAG: hypothetical protein ACI4PZ_00490 [Akkermansia sp.]
MRPAACARLRWQDISEDEGVVSVRAAAAIGQSIPEALLSPSMTPSDAAAFSRLAAGSVKLLRASATLRPNAEKAFMPINA